MRVLLALLLFVVLSGCGNPEPVAQPVAEKAIDPLPVAPKAEAQPAAAQPENPKNNPAPDTVAPQQAPVKPPAHPQPVQPPVVEKPQQPVAPNRAPGKVPLLVSVRTKAGKKHVGELIERTDAGLVVYDIVLCDTVSINNDQVQSFIEGIDERTASSHVPFATFAAWKLTKLLRIGTVQGRIALASNKGIFINLGSAHGLSAGQSVTLLDKAEEITDPKSGKQLAVYRAPVATLKILTVVNERLSKLSITASDKPVNIERGMTVACERGSTTIVVIPPQWKSEDPNLKTGDEALYLTEHILAELVRFGVPVISRDQVEQAQAELSQKTGKPVATLPAATVGQTLKAGVLVTGQILAKGRTGNVTLHVTDLATRQYVGILAGRIRRDKIREESKKAKKAADDIKKQVGSLPAEMARRKKIATQLIEAGVYVVLKLPNGTSVLYENKQLPAPEVGFPPVFAFQEVRFRNGNAHLSSLLAGLRLRSLRFDTTDSQPQYFEVFQQGIRIDDLLIFHGPVEEHHIKRIPRGTKALWLFQNSRVSARWLATVCPTSVENVTPGPGVSARELPMLRHHLKFFTLGLCPQQLTEGWTKFIPRGVPSLVFAEASFKTNQDFESLRRGLGELQKSDYFTTHLQGLSISHFQQEEALMEQLLEGLLLSPIHRPRALSYLDLKGLNLRPQFTQRLRAAYPTVKIILRE